MNKGKMPELGIAWEELRKQACQLENEIDLKLVSFSKLGTNYRSVRDYSAFQSVAHRSHFSSENTSPAVSKSSTSHMFEAMAMEIEQLLASLTKVNDRMSEHTLNAQNATLLHMVQRHRDILQDYSHEFQKTKNNILAVREREELLGSAYRDGSSYKNSSQTDLYLKEHEHITNASRLVDEQISIAMSTKENMQAQKSALYAITHRMNFLANRFPVINSLVVRINLRKRRDTIIIACVIALCLIFLLWFTLH
jgi:Golgi SNAP receptor complex protein 1